MRIHLWNSVGQEIWKSYYCDNHVDYIKAHTSSQYIVVLVFILLKCKASVVKITTYKLKV